VWCELYSKLGDANDLASLCGANDIASLCGANDIASLFGANNIASLYDAITNYRASASRNFQTKSVSPLGDYVNNIRGLCHFHDSDTLSLS
jgi:hypothetical protein